jgi:hypothetical protein
MRNIYPKIGLITAFTACSVSAFAVPFNSFDPRSMSMGGVGVAVGDPSTAPFFNPALLSAGDRRKKFALELPIIGARLYDPSSMRSNLTTLSDDITTLQNAITAANASANGTTAAQISQLPTTLTTLGSAITKVNTALSALNNQPVQGEFGAATVVSMPGKNLGIALYADAWGAIGGTLEYNDAATLTSLSTAVTSTANALSAATTVVGTSCASPQTAADIQACITAAGTAASTLVSAQGVVNFSTNTNIASKLHMRGVGITETGVSLSHGFVSADHRFSIGITPKMMRIHMYDATLAANAGGISGMTGSDYYAFYSSPNVDVGITKNFPNGFRTGLVVKNAISHVYEFKSAVTPGTAPVANGSKLTIRPMVRAGIAYEVPLFTIAVDADLTKNDPAGLENYSQNVGLGVEVGVTDWTQLRFGYRNDMLDKTRRDTVSVGVGVSPRLPFFKPHFDLAVVSSPNLLRDGYDKVNEVGLAFRFGFNF